MNDDTQTFIDNMIKVQRDAKFKESEQITLGELIKQLKSVPLRTGEDEQYVIFDFCGLQPDTFNSWRGSYSELALGYTNEKGYAETKLSSFIKQCEDCINKSFGGWKGGKFLMTKNTPVWVDNSGEASGTMIVGIIDDGFRIIIQTKYGEY